MAGRLAFSRRSAPPAGAHAYFDSLVARSDTYGSATLRGANHHKSAAEGGYAVQINVTTDYVGSHDPVEDAMKIEIPAFATWYDNTRISFVEALNDTDSSTTVTLVAWEVLSARMLLFPTGEIVTVTSTTNSTIKQITFSRGQFGTTKQPLAAGTFVKVSRNGMLSQENLVLRQSVGASSLNTTDGHTYLFCWEVKYDPSYMTGPGGSGLTSHKAWTIRDSFGDGNKWFEVQTVFADTVNSSCFDGSTIASIRARTYIGVYGGEANWGESNGNQAGPGITNNSLLPGNNDDFCIKSNRWTRFWLRVEQRLLDYDYVSLWCADEVTPPFQVYDQLPLSLPDDVMNSFYIEMGTSTTEYVQPSPNHVLKSWIRNWWVGEQDGLASDGDYSDAGMAALMEQP